MNVFMYNIRFHFINFFLQARLSITKIKIKKICAVTLNSKSEFKNHMD
jgi:hypothetical protein